MYIKFQSKINVFCCLLYFIPIPHSLPFAQSIDHTKTFYNVIFVLYIYCLGNLILGSVSSSYNIDLINLLTTGGVNNICEHVYVMYHICCTQFVNNKIITRCVSNIYLLMELLLFCDSHAQPVFSVPPKKSYGIVTKIKSNGLWIMQFGIVLNTFLI